MRKSKRYYAAIKGVGDLKHDTFTVDALCPSKLTHEQMAERIRVMLFSYVDELEEITVH